MPELIANARQGTFSTVAAKLATVPPEKLTQRSVNDAKVTDHHALLPTENRPHHLSGEEPAVYELVVGRMLEAFHRACRKKITDVVLDIAQDVYLAKGMVILEMGWREVFSRATDEEEEGRGALPALVPGDLLAVLSAQLLEKQTQPKPLFTEATLLKAMETCGREIEEEALRDAMKESGLGTPATRAQIIERLFRVQYLERKGKSLVPTDKGIALYELVKDKLISQAELTGRWEKGLESIRAERLSPERFMAGIHRFVRKLTEEFLTQPMDYQAPEDGQLVCPKCQRGRVREGAKSYYCSRYKAGCDFTVWKKIAGKRITPTMVQALVRQGKTRKLKGFTSRSNQPFEAVLFLDEHQKVAFSFS